MRDSLPLLPSVHGPFSCLAAKPIFLLSDFPAKVLDILPPIYLVAHGMLTDFHRLAIELERFRYTAIP